MKIFRKPETLNQKNVSELSEGVIYDAFVFFAKQEELYSANVVMSAVASVFLNYSLRAMNSKEEFSKFLNDIMEAFVEHIKNSDKNDE